MSTLQRPSAELVRNLFDYDVTRGLLIWKQPTGKRVHVGMAAGTKHRSGYWRIGFNRRNYTLAHIVWLHVNGVWPEPEIDHIDGDKDNNAIGNLRLATRSQNEANKPARSMHGRKGVSFEKRTGRWKASIQAGGKPRHLGYFDTAEQAGAAYASAAIIAYGEFLCPDRRGAA